jgi:glycerol-3-phosphate cytidylyltransferase
MKINKKTGCIESTIGFTCSCFDLLHAGHILMLRDAKSRCDRLIVGLQTDPTIDRPDTKNKPIQSLEERRIQLESVKYVNEIFEYGTEEELYKKLLDINPDVRILGSDYIGKSFTGDDLDIEIYYHERKHNYSSTNLRGKIVSEHLHRETEAG